jgi:lipoprotein-anchoring transpeptidase ErfK/SrfK
MTSSKRAGLNVFSASGRRLPRPGKWTTLALGVVAAAALIAVAGIAYAGYDYSRKYEGRILPGASIAGVDVGGMTRSEALRVVRQAVRPELHREFTVEARGRKWVVKPRELGAVSTARRAVDSALSASETASFIEKTRMRVFGSTFDHDQAVQLRYPRAAAADFVEQIAARYDREAADAEIDYSTGWVKVVKEHTGREVRIGASVKALRSALNQDADEAALSVAIEQPEVTRSAFQRVLLVRIGENKVYLYENGRITHEWLVATGLPEYQTPTGVYSVQEKRYMPTWVNPAPDTWGKSMPESIPPGPSNPLGLRAINWSAPAIRFHGTSATYSLGFNASHGCVRMSNDDVITLYDIIQVGDPIVSVEVAPYRPLYTSSTNSTPQAENDAGAVEERNSNNDSGNGD